MWITYKILHKFQKECTPNGYLTLSSISITSQNLELHYTQFTKKMLLRHQQLFPITNLLLFNKYWACINYYIRL